MPGESVSLDFVIRCSSGNGPQYSAFSSLSSHDVRLLFRGQKAVETPE